MAVGFHALSSRVRTAIFALIVLSAALGAERTVIGHERALLSVRRSQLAAVESELRLAEAAAARLPAVEQGIRVLEASPDGQAGVPAETDATELLRRINETATESGLSLTGWQPKPSPPKAADAEPRVELDFEGNYHDLVRFFDRMARTGALMSVSDLHITTRSRPAGRGAIAASFVAARFVFRKNGDVLAATQAQAHGAARHVAERYENDGLRDPFAIPIAPGRPTTGATAHRQFGLGGLAVADVSVTGIVRGRDLALAILQGPHKQSFVARTGDRLLDAIVKRIDDGAVVFVDRSGPAGGAGTIEIRKLLRLTEPVR